MNNSNTNVRLQQVFQQLKQKNEKAFIPFFVIGDPNPQDFIKIIKEIEPFADIIELGIPFSDPIADGPVIQNANQRALTNGVTLSKAFDLISQIRSFTQKPIVLLTYANIIGLDLIAQETLLQLAKNGVDGVIAAEVPIEEAEGYLKAMKFAGIDMILLAAPTTNEIRLKELVKNAQGFLYVVSVKGTTGARESILNETLDTITRIAKYFPEENHIPICVGFGISQPTHVEQIIKLGADGVIVGSAIIKIIEENASNPEKMRHIVTEYIRSMKNATKKNGSSKNS